MTRRIALLALLFAGACNRVEQDRMTVSWTSADSIVGSGRMVLPVRSSWCSTTSQVLLVAQAGDSGAALRIRTDTIGPAEFSVVDTTISRLPAALVALRFIRGARIVQVGSDSGQLELTEARSGGAFSGSWNAWFSDPVSRTPIEGRGTFRSRLVDADSIECPMLAPASEPADSITAPPTDTVVN